MANPLVSVVIPCFNYARYVAQAVQSALAQDYSGALEVITVDDGSTDNTLEVLQPFVDKIVCLRKQRGGTSSALNAGIASARGKYICWLSADDLFRADKVRVQVGQLEYHSEWGFVYSSFRIIDANGIVQNSVYSNFYPEHSIMVRQLMNGCFINGSSVMMRREALDRVGPFDEALPQAHDYDMWFRLLRYYSCGFSNELLISYRWHGQNLSRTPDLASENLVKKRAKGLFPEYFNGE